MAGTLPDTVKPAAESRNWLERLWASIAERGRPFAAVPGGSVAASDRARLLAEALLSERGEASGAAVARELQSVLAGLSADQLKSFFLFAAAGFQPDATRLHAAAQAYLAEPSAENTAALAEAAEPPRQELLRRMNLAPGGTATLVALRKTLLGMLRREPALQPLDGDLRHLFISWFNRGFLELRRIDWQTPAAVLEKLIAYEAVHEIAGWDDLRRRLAPDRRCFGFFHPALPGEPLIFVEVALVEGLATAIQPLLTPADEAGAPAREARADTAIFYSISNCQDGLRGVSFGNFLIKQVVEVLRAERPTLTRFSTLSPVPGFRRWVEARLATQTDPPSSLPPSPVESTDGDRAELLRPIEGGDGGTLATLLGDEGWCADPVRQRLVRPALLRLCARYLTQNGLGRGIDTVARFHLGNGARLEQVNWMGNSAPRGLAESYGIMVNYLYDPKSIETNHEAFVRDGVVARAPAVDALMVVPTSPSPRRGHTPTPRSDRPRPMAART